MKHPPISTPEYYQRIQGWFDFHDIYDLAVSEAQPRDRLVEVGCWLGKSICYLAERSIMDDKDLRLFAVDTFAGNDVHVGYGEEFLRSLHQQFLSNVAGGGYLDIVRTLAIESVTASRLFPDESIFLVFLDGCHEYEAVRADILAWFPKVRSGGILAGHDYWTERPGVVQAVNEIFPSRFTVSRRSWMIRK